MKGLRRVAVVFALVVTAGTILAATELVLRDGRVVSGADVRRDGDDYLLTLESGDVIVVPAVLVEAVGLTGEGEPEDARPETVAGPTIEPPGPSEQLRVFGEPARFQRGFGTGRWQPSSDWDMDPARQNNWNPSAWAADIIDPDWAPESAFDPDEDVLAAGRSTWQESVTDPNWAPADGFAR